LSCFQVPAARSDSAISGLLMLSKEARGPEWPNFQHKRVQIGHQCIQSEVAQSISDGVAVDRVRMESSAQL
jgi:hypothetical protein